MKIRVSRLFEYPIKGFGPLRHVYAAKVSPRGRLGVDRCIWLQRRSDECIINGKWALREKRLDFFRIRVSYDEPLSTVYLGEADSSNAPTAIRLENLRSLGRWFSEYFGFEISAQSDHVLGRPDDLELPGMTVLSEASATMMGEWFGWSADHLIARLRPNLLLDGLEAFGEWQLLGRQIRIGNTILRLAQACTRCAVPAANPETGERHKGFEKTFGKLMRPHLLRLAPKGFERDEHGYYASINTRAASVATDAHMDINDTVILLPE